MESMKARDFRRAARQALGGGTYFRYVLGLMLLSLVATLAVIAGIFGFVAVALKFGPKLAEGPAASVPADSVAAADAVAHRVAAWCSALMADPTALAVFAAVVLVVACLFVWLAGWVSWGKNAMAVAAMRGGMTFAHAFSGRGHAWRMGGLVLARGVYVQLWMLLLIVPGVIKVFSYALSEFVAIDHPDWSANRCITESRRLMAGNRWRLFCLLFSFLPWYLVLVVVACLPAVGGSVNFLTYLLSPYVTTAVAAFYERRLDEALPLDDRPDVLKG